MQDSEISQWIRVKRLMVLWATKRFLLPSQTVDCCLHFCNDVRLSCIPRDSPQEVHATPSWLRVRLSTRTHSEAPDAKSMVLGCLTVSKGLSAFGSVTVRPPSPTKKKHGVGRPHCHRTEGGEAKISVRKPSHSPKTTITTVSYFGGAATSAV